MNPAFDTADRENLRLIPRILRARDFHLYTEGGKRLTDLWLEGGRALLGHKPPKVLVELKNAAERGLFCSLPHPMERRFLKALEVLFPGRVFRLYTDESSRSRALKEAGFSEEDEVFTWRPFLNDGGQLPSVLEPVLPWPQGPAVLVLERSMEASFPSGDLVPPVLLAPAARALYNLASELKAPAPNRGCPRYHKIAKALGGQKAENYIWRRNGIYLTVEEGTNREKYKELFLRFLEGSFLIPPSPCEPLILPGAMSDGEESRLAGLLIGVNHEKK